MTPAVRKKICYLLTAIAYLGPVVTVPFVEGPGPYVLGLPVLLFLMVFWVIAGAVLLCVVELLNPDAHTDGEG